MVSTETYKAIQSWIGRQLEYEETNSTPAPVTDAQRKLLEKLELILPPEIPPPSEPELDDTNWVGILLEYRVSRQRIVGDVPGVNFVEIPGPTIGGEQKWHCQVRIDEHSAPFPGTDGGLFPDGSLPYFGRKKDAKKYAAMCAVHWLQTQGYMPGQVQEQQATSQPPPVIGKRKFTPSSPENREASTPKPESSGSQLFPGSPIPKGMASPFNSDEISATHEVSRLCERLGHAGFPKYKITESNEQRGFYSGYADLDLLSEKLPEGVGRVENVLGQKPAREKIAEELLVHLRKLAAEYDEADRQFLARSPPVKEESPAPARKSMDLIDFS
ncbi:hypothetical protein K449DRAFT_390830 [Hypoxylon sp. EC38]|nr:hypothetical protein K449DRAFT_390830 [Hypoxylon sp. EC38]